MIRFRAAFRLAFVIAIAPVAAFVSCVEDSKTTPPDNNVDGSLPDGSGVDGATPGPDAATEDTGTGSDATSDTSVTTDATSTDAADAADAADASITPQPGDLFVNASTGNDSNTGLVGQPFKSLTKALATATSGKVVWLENGTWDAAIDPKLGVASAAAPCASAGLAVPTGVSVRALNAGGATIVVTGSYGLCATGGTTFAGFKMSRPTGGGNPLVFQGGTGSLDGVEISTGSAGYGYAMVEMSGGATVTMSPGGLATYAVSNGVFADLVDANTTLIVNGGAFNDVRYAGFARQGVFMVRAGAKLVLNGVLVDRPVANQTAQEIIGINTSGTVELRGNTIIRGFHNAQGVFANFGANVLVTDNTEIYGNAWGVFASGFGTAAQTLVTLSGSSKVRNNTLGGVRGDYVNGHDLALTITGSASITQNAGTGVEYSAGTFTMTGGSVTNNTGNGVAVATALDAFTMRNATITGNGQVGVLLGNFTGLADLGTKASPGNNVIANNGGTHNLRTSRTQQDAGTNAVGNVYDPDVQGTNDAGVVVSPDGGKVELVGPLLGKNFGVYGTGHRLLIADP